MAKGKEWTIPSVGEKAKQLELITVLTGMQNGTATSETSVAIPYKIKHTLTI